MFTWWAPWRNMRQRNIGWRLDYVLASQSLFATVTQLCRAARDRHQRSRTGDRGLRIGSRVRRVRGFDRCGVRRVRGSTGRVRRVRVRQVQVRQVQVAQLYTAPSRGRRSSPEPTRRALSARRTADRSAARLRRPSPPPRGGVTRRRRAGGGDPRRTRRARRGCRRSRRLYVLYTPARHPHVRTRLESPRMIRISPP